MLKAEVYGSGKEELLSNWKIAMERNILAMHIKQLCQQNNEERHAYSKSGPLEFSRPTNRPETKVIGRPILIASIYGEHLDAMSMALSKSVTSNAKIK